MGPIAEMTSEVAVPNLGTPAWWLKRLSDELDARLPDMQAYRALVDDEHPAPDSVEAGRKFRRIAGLSTTNLTGLAVEATAERITVEGVRIGDQPEADQEVWDNVWQRSNFDEGSQDATTAALTYSRSFVSVEPPSAASPFSRLHYEDPRQVVLSYLPDGSRGPALKVFTDEWTGTTFATLYSANFIVKMQREGTPGVDARWSVRSLTGEEPVTRNPLGEVPFFELQNKLTGAIRSEVAPLLIPQRRLNQIVYNTDAVAEYGAFRQKWATGIEVLRDAENRPIAPYDPNVAKLFVSDKSDVRFGNFDVTDMAPYIDLARETAAHISRLSRVPITYFLSNISNLGGDALALLISGLVLKCERRVKGYEPALEGAIRLALKAQGDPRALAPNIEVKWADMDTRSMAQSADAAVKLTQGDKPVISTETAQEQVLGLSATERARDAARTDA